MKSLQFKQIILLISVLFIPLCEALCSMAGAPNGFPPKKIVKPSPPFKVVENKVCPYYSGQLGCCNNIQISQLETNFASLDAIFKADCPICALNLKLFWCEFTCNPNQSKFLIPHEVIKVKHGDELVDALNITVVMSAAATCEIYRSCGKVPETTMMASNGQGFLQFQVLL